MGTLAGPVQRAVAPGFPELGITAFFGSALVPVEARSPAEALRPADRRMYAHKTSQVGTRAA